VVNIRQEGKTSLITTETENVGLGGVCVLLERELNIFSPVELELTLVDEKPPLKVQGTIVWVVRRADRKKGPCFDTGIEFAELTPEHKTRLQAVIQSASHAG